MSKVSTPLSGVTFDLSGLGAYVSDGVQLFMPLFLLAGGVILAGVVLTKGLSFLRGATGGRR